jgi:hypothetical protein
LKLIAIGASIAVVLLGVFLYLLLGGTKPTKGKDNNQDQEDALKVAQDMLSKKTDLTTCRAALDKVKDHLRTQQDRPPTLDAATRDFLKQRFALTDEEVAEISADSYTLLDGHDLDQCFLLRDAARSIEAEARGAGGPRLTPLDQATAAFAWVVRQVRLEAGVFPAVPPQFALRRGWGTPMDRALVFLSLLEQFGSGEGEQRNGRPNLLGCLVAFPRAEGMPELWACGVLIEDDPQVYLFDPRLGLPLPGPGGKGVATLADARKDPAVLAQLNVKPVQQTPGRPLAMAAGCWVYEPGYDVRAKRAVDADLYQYVPLSAMAPRLRHLQEKLLPPQVRVNLAVDAQADTKKLQAAAAALPGERPVAVTPLPHYLFYFSQRGGTGAHAHLRNFLMKDEGGNDPRPEIQLNLLRGFVAANNPTKAPLPQGIVFDLEMVPWFDMPLYFRDQERFPFHIGLGEGVRGKYAEPFKHFATEPGQGRDLMLRGKQRDAVTALTQERGETADQLREMRRIQNQVGLLEELDAWVGKMQAAYAELLRAKDNPPAKPAAERAIGALWANETGQKVMALIQGAAAQTRSAEATYYLALCKHDRAEQLQARLDLTARIKKEPVKAATEWVEVEYWWTQFTNEFPHAHESDAVRRLHGRALDAQGKHEEAARIWNSDTPTRARGLDRVACLYLAAQARRK